MTGRDKKIFNEAVFDLAENNVIGRRGEARGRVVPESFWDGPDSLLAGIHFRLDAKDLRGLMSVPGAVGKRAAKLLLAQNRDCVCSLVLASRFGKDAVESSLAAVFKNGGSLWTEALAGDCAPFERYESSLRIVRAAGKPKEPGKAKVSRFADDGGFSGFALVDVIADAACDIMDFLGD